MIRRFLLKVPFIRNLPWLKRTQDWVLDRSDMRYDSRSAYEYAGDAIDKVLGNAKNAKVKPVKRQGERRIGGIWAWREPLWNMAWILGLCVDGNPTETHIGVNPATGKEWDMGTKRHEKGHARLFRHGIYDHDPRFDTSFEGWAESRRASGARFAGIFQRVKKRPPTHHEAKMIDNHIMVAEVVDDQDS